VLRKHQGEYAACQGSEHGEDCKMRSACVFEQSFPCTHRCGQGALQNDAYAVGGVGFRGRKSESEIKGYGNGSASCRKGVDETHDKPRNDKCDDDGNAHAIWSSGFEKNGSFPLCNQTAFQS